MKLWTTVTNIGYYEILKEDAGEGSTDWTINRNAAPGDQVLLYVCAPVSAIVAVAEVSETPRREDNPQSEWCGFYFAEMHGLRMLPEPITRQGLMEKFPTWGYWKQPRASVQVPQELEDHVKGMLHV